ncbi:ogr/Delta-like zinc finger family protein [Pseudoalteromonas sp. BZB3]|uniref:ogr/Delta-like zinc finger family protein n=1 Tax=Pseudoalteromonas sp. BZB3 TaxID=3136670 RepID=UPI0032C41D43
MALWYLVRCSDGCLPAHQPLYIITVLYLGIWCRVMRVNCPNCESKAIITSRENQSTGVADLYCSCTNSKECGATFVTTIAFKHFLNPPRKDTAKIAISLVKALPKHEQFDLIEN